MAENDQTIRKIDWKSVFPFIHLFRGFRLAIDPSKLVLALAAILMLYIGGRLMDAIWPVHSRAMDQEIARYAAYVGDDFHAVRKSAAEDRIAAIRAAVSRTEDADDLGDVSDGFEDQLDKSVDAAHDAYNKLPAEAKNDDARKARDAAVQRAYSVYAQQCKELGEVKGEGLFIHFINYQIDQVDAAAAAATSLDALTTSTSRSSSPSTCS
jgi:hypothetical protein